ncbi:MAG: flavin-containing monooxygenase [Alphaproteobacteria bacterium]
MSNGGNVSASAALPTGLQTAIIVGAGASGLCTAIKLKQQGIDKFVILELSDGVGGTWRDNSYPGSGCDVPSHLYSFSFEPNPNWTRRFSRQPEILDYFEFVADKYKLRPHIVTNTRVDEARYDAENSTWKVTTDKGDVVEGRFLISGTGQLNRPFVPEIEGTDSFAGTAFHSARWNHDHDLTGKNIAVIGNGASAIQFVPEIVPKAANVTIFQRSANWIVEKPDRSYPAWERALYKYVKPLLWLSRQRIFYAFEMRFSSFKQGTWLNKVADKAAREHMEEELKTDEARALHIPDYPIGCKRVLISNDYLAAVQEPHVKVNTSGVAKIEADAIIGNDGQRHEIDTLIYSTGFKTSEFISPMKVVGVDGIDLNAAWKEGAEAHQGITVAGFPNFFMAYGPNTNLGHNSIIFMVECQVRYIMNCLNMVLARDLKALDVKREAMSAYNTRLQNALGDTIWAAGCDSWYKNDAGKIVNNWSGYALGYRKETRKLSWDDYQLIA